MNWLAGNFHPPVLIVEDDPVAALLLERIFQNQGVRVNVAENAEVAIKLHRSHPYRLIISDWMLPGQSGVDLCRDIRQLGGEYVYFMVCTSRIQRQDRLQAFESGVDDFISKPVDREELLARVKVASRLIQSRELVRTKSEELEVVAERLTRLNVSLHAASRRFEEMFNGLPVASFTLDSQGTIQEWNRVATESFGIATHNAIQRPVWEVFESDEFANWSPELISRLFAGEQVKPFDWAICEQGSNPRFFAGHIICLRNSSGSPVAAVCVNIDITERKTASIRIEQYAEQLCDQKRELERANEQLGRLALTDGLTGLWNHRRFQEMLEDSIKFHRARQLPFSLILFDVDHFKRFNDEFGHQTGDQVLKQFADTLRSTARMGELCSRYGGEEFAVLLQGCDREEAQLAAERFTLAIRRQNWKHRVVTASLGVATFSDFDTSGPALVKQADRALYASKSAGRNRVTHFEDVESSNAQCA